MSTVKPSFGEPAAAYARRGRRQTVAVLAVATLVGIWLGTSAPAVSPAAPPAAAARSIPAPATFDQPRPGGAGRPR